MAGGCVSLCGSGPVLEILVVDVEGGGIGGGVVAPSSLSKKRKRVKGREAITSLLDKCVATTTVEGAEVGSALKPYMRDRLTSGYELSIEANAAYASRDYRLTTDLYLDAIERGRKPAMLLQEAREAGCSVAGPDGTTTSDDVAVVVDGGYPTRLRWLINSLKNSCRCRLLLRDVDGARRDAFTARVFSRNADPDAHECLAKDCAASRDTVGELQDLKSAVRHYDVVERDPGRADAAGRASCAAARKRELGFCICVCNINEAYGKPYLSDTRQLVLQSQILCQTHQFSQSRRFGIFTHLRESRICEIDFVLKKNEKKPSKHSPPPRPLYIPARPPHFTYRFAHLLFSCSNTHLLVLLIFPSALTLA